MIDNRDEAQKWAQNPLVRKVARFFYARNMGWLGRLVSDAHNADRRLLMARTLFARVKRRAWLSFQEPITLPSYGADGLTNIERWNRDQSSRIYRRQMGYRAMMADRGDLPVRVDGTWRWNLPVDLVESTGLRWVRVG